MLSRRSLFSWAATGALLCGCSDHPDATERDDSGTVEDSSRPDVAPPDDSGLGLHCTGASPRFARDVVPIFQGCAGFENCHGGQFVDYALLVGATTQRDMCTPARALVTPGDLGHSYVLNKVTGIDMCANAFRMPPGGMLARDKIQTIADWICVGAPND
jgi:hypothetical protein